MPAWWFILICKRFCESVQNSRLSSLKFLSECPDGGIGRPFPMTFIDKSNSCFWMLDISQDVASLRPTAEPRYITTISAPTHSYTRNTRRSRPRPPGNLSLDIWARVTGPIDRMGDAGFVPLHIPEEIPARMPQRTNIRSSGHNSPPNSGFNSI